MTTAMSAASSDVTSNIMLYDSEIKKIADGPIAWANNRVGSARSIDDFHKGLVEQFNRAGFLVDAAVCTLGECKCGPLALHDAEHCRHLVPIENTYTFQVTILDRVVRESGFDYDRMKHEVQANLLEIPGEGGKIKFDEKEFLQQHGGGRRHKHG